MDINRKVRTAADFGRRLHYFDTPAGKPAKFGVRLNALDQIRVVLCRPHGGVDVDALRTIELRVVVPFNAAYQIGGQVGDDPRLGRLGDKLAKTRQRHAARPPLVNQGRDTRINTAHVWIESESAREILVDMRMGVDQARKD